MHIVDGALSVPVLAASGASAAAAVGIGSVKTDYESIPRVGVMASVFFVASLIRVPVGPSSAHLLLPALMGIVLGWAVFPALAVALFLQAILFGFGGITSLGANILVMGVPGIACHYLFGRSVRAIRGQESVFALSFTAGAAGIIVAWLVLGLLLMASGRSFTAAVVAVGAAHIPVVVIEGFVTAFAVSFLHRIRPLMLAGPALTTVPED